MRLLLPTAAHNSLGCAATASYPACLQQWPLVQDWQLLIPQLLSSQSRDGGQIGILVSHLQRQRLKRTGLLSWSKDKSSDSDCPRNHSQEGSEIGYRLGGNESGDCLVTSTSLHCHLCPGPGSLSQDRSPDSGPFPRPNHAWCPRPGLGRAHQLGLLWQTSS